MMQLAHDIFSWITILVVTFLFTVAEHLVATFHLKRSHHRKKTIQECLTAHQFSYFSFFSITLATIGFGQKSLLAKVVLLCAILALVFWAVGLRIVYLQDESIGHQCAGATCNNTVAPHFLRANKVMAWVIGIVALGVIVAISYFKPGIVP
jgi:hypothetical protein